MARVEICGVSTSRLPRLTQEENEALLKRVRAGDERAREEIVEGNLRLVLSVIQRFSGRDDADDLFQVGCIGLMKAIENFDFGFGVMFSTYAVPLISGEVRRFLRDSAPIRVSRSLRDTAYKVLQARERLTSESGREPTVEEIAQEIGMRREDVVIALDAAQEPVSLNEPVYSDDREEKSAIDSVRDERQTDEAWLNEIALADAVRELGEREKRILNLRFFDGKTQTEVAKIVGISQAQVSRLEKNAVERIKMSL